MEKIGDFAKRCEVTIKTLRYYDKLGLLVPDYIDNFTGYRYYSAEKVEKLRHINELKNFGFSLKEIKRFYSTENNEKKLQTIQVKRKSLEKMAEEIKLRLQKITEIETKLNLEITEHKEDKKMNNIYNMPFVNDERVIGRWQSIGSVAKKDDFTSERNICKNESYIDEIYFLPNGNEYWGFSWTKDYLKISFGDGLLCRYEIEEIEGKPYMFVEYHTEDKTEMLVLVKTDNKHYTKYEIRQCDDIDLPFVSDPDVIGKWSVVDFVKEISDFNPAKKSYKDPFYLNAIEFFHDGKVNNTYNNETCTFRWTKGTLLIKNGDGTTAPAYEIKIINGAEYLFYEWKSGDYIYGKRKPYYYVLKREF